MFAFDRVGWAAAALLLSGCVQKMVEQPRYTPNAPSAQFADGASTRRAPEGTFAQGQPIGRLAKPPLTMALMARGRARYDIACAPCHGLAGDGKGIIPAHGFPAPPTYHQPRLRKASDAHIYDVITHGWGVMYPYAARVTPEERWAIAAYIRALQLSQGGTGGPR